MKQILNFSTAMSLIGLAIAANMLFHFKLLDIQSLSWAYSIGLIVVVWAMMMVTITISGLPIMLSAGAINKPLTFILMGFSLSLIVFILGFYTAFGPSDNAPKHALKIMSMLATVNLAWQYFRGVQNLHKKKVMSYMYDR